MFTASFQSPSVISASENYFLCILCFLHKTTTDLIWFCSIKGSKENAEIGYLRHLLDYEAHKVIPSWEQATILS